MELKCNEFEKEFENLKLEHEKEIEQIRIEFQIYLNEMKKIYGKKVLELFIIIFNNNIYGIYH